MKEQALSTIGIVVALLGFSFLLLYLSIVDVPLSTKPPKEGMSAFEGDIQAFHETDKVASILLDTRCTRTVVLFKDSPLSFKEGDHVQIIGKLEEYGGSSQFVVHRMDTIEAVGD